MVKGSLKTAHGGLKERRVFTQIPFLLSFKSVPGVKRITAAHREGGKLMFTTHFLNPDT